MILKIQGVVILKCILNAFKNGCYFNLRTYYTIKAIYYHLNFIKQPSLVEVAWRILLPFLLKAVLRIQDKRFLPIPETYFAKDPVHGVDQ